MIGSTPSLLIACLSETLAYGIALVLFVLSMLTLLKRRSTRENVNWPLFVAAPVLFFLATLHIFGVWIRTYKAFCTFSAGPDAYFGLITTPEKTVTQVGQVGGVILADFMTIYRTLIIWRFKYHVVILPTVTAVATIICAVGFITEQHEVNVHTSIFSKAVTQWTESFLACSLITTGVCTGLIVYKLLRPSGKLNQAIIFEETRSLASRVVRIVVESAALYSLNNFFYALLYSLKINPESWFSGLEASVASITFSLIIIRVESVVNRPPVLAPLSFAPGKSRNAGSWPTNSSRTVGTDRVSTIVSTSLPGGDYPEGDAIGYRDSVTDSDGHMTFSVMSVDPVSNMATLGKQLPLIPVNSDVGSVPPSAVQHYHAEKISKGEIDHTGSHEAAV